MSGFSDAVRLYGRRFANAGVRLLPKPLVRHILKSFWQQPGLQDDLRFHVEPYRYESAAPTGLDVDRERLQRRRHLPGIEFPEARFLALLQALEPYAAEFAGTPVQETPGSQFWLHNGGFEDFDAITLYGMIRRLKPKRMIEVGCGFSSRVTAAACERNQAEGHPCDLLFIEPYPSEAIRKNPLPGRFLEKKIQDVPLDVFKELRANDVLFIDTTHVIKAQSDCCYELLEVLPSLVPGVFVHVHDIFTPYDYPGEWLLDYRRPFNEQYGLECLLSHSQGFEVVLPVYFLFAAHLAALRRLLPQGTSRAGSFWLKRKAVPAT